MLPTLTSNRSGTLSQRALVNLCYSGLEKKEINGMIFGRGGLAAQVCTTDLRELEKQFEDGIPTAAVVFQAMGQQAAME